MNVDITGVHRVSRITYVILAAVLVLALLAVPKPLPAKAATLDVGVLSSQSSRNFGTGIPPHPWAKTNVALREQRARDWVAASSHNLVELTDADLESPAELAGIDVLVLPYTWAMNEKASRTVRDWVRQGGGLISILTSPRVFLDGSSWQLWALELNYEGWEWGPLSEAYQMMFVNDPSATAWQAVVDSGHPIGANALSALGLSTARFTDPDGSGIELSYKYNKNVTPVMHFAGLGTDKSTGQSLGQYNGFSAAQASHYGSGRVVYFDFQLLDFVSPANLSIIPLGDGVHDHGDLADALLDSAVDWAANGGGFGTIKPTAVTYGTVNSFGTQITIRQHVKATGNAVVSGHLRARVFNPDGVQVHEDRRDFLGVEPGRTHTYNWNYLKGSDLDSGQYHVILSYTFTYPDYRVTSMAEAFVVRGQGRGIPTRPVDASKSLSPLTGNFDGSGGDDLATFDSIDGSWTVWESTGNDFDPSLWADFSTTSGWQARMTGDYDGNGRDDIAQFHPSNGTWWISRSTGGSFNTQKWADFSSASGWQSRVTGDFSGDGRDDIAQFHPSNGTWWISRSTGGGFSTTQWADFSTASGWQAPMVGDFNGDGRADIAQFHPSNGTWWISRSTGSGFVTEVWADFSTASGWLYRMVGDFNGDGRDDIAQFHPSNGTWWISRSTGSGFITELWADYSTTSGWQAQMVGDYNGDGRDDIAQFHPSNGTWWISRSTGAGFSTTLWADFTTASGWQARMTADFSGDGRDDVVQYHDSNASWWVSRSTGSSFVTTNWSD